MPFGGVRALVYYAAVFSFALLEEPMNHGVLFTVGVAQFYVIDLLFVVVSYAFVRVILSKGVLAETLEVKVYVVFILWLLLAVVRGIPIYGYRAIGESRHILPLLAFFVPLLLFRVSSPADEVILRSTIRKTIYVAALAAGLAFVVALVRLWAGELSLEEGDFRGLRFLTGNQTFYLLLLVTFLVVRLVQLGKITAVEKFALISALVAAVISKNRTPFVSFGVGLLVFLAVRVKIGQVLRMAVVVVLLLAGISALFPELWEQVAVAFGGILNPGEDPTGQWRIGIQLAAVEQALETPWLGQGFGGYFSFVIPGLNNDLPFELPPHDQFVMLFLKTGIVGVLLSIATILAFSRRAIGLCRAYASNAEIASTMTVLLLLVATQLIYGLAYDFFPMFGLFCGLGVVYFKTLTVTASPASVSPGKA